MFACSWGIRPPQLLIRRNTAETATKEGSGEGHHSFNSYRALPPDELEKLDLRFRIVAPDEADAWSVADWVAWISERSAILEFDADFSKEQADQEAMLIWRLYRDDD